MDPAATLKESAHALNISPATVYKLLKDRRLVGAKVGGQWRISREVLRAALRGGEVGGEQGESEQKAV